MDLFAETIRVTETLGNWGAPYALIGGLAYAIRIQARYTDDIDLLMASPAKRVRKRDADTMKTE